MARHIRARVDAGARNERFHENSDGSFVISVREPAEGNAANKRVIELLALHLGVSERAIRIVNGHRRPSKLLAIQDS